MLRVGPRVTVKSSEGREGGNAYEGPMSKISLTADLPSSSKGDKFGD